MSMRTLGAALGLMGLLTLAPGCADDRRTGPRPGSDGGTTDAGTTDAASRPPLPPTPPGGVSVGIDSASWGAFEEGSLLRLAVRVGSASDGTPAPLVFSAFSLETDLGAVLDADFSSRSTCPEGISVAPGAVLPCAVSFQVPPGQTPVRLRYTADATRMAMAPITSCSSAAPTGLCSPGQVCQSGSCQTQCSSSAPEGFCPGAGEQCRSGECVAPCSPTAPSGYCTEGTCIDGACDTSCVSINTSDGACIGCIVEVGIDSCSSAEPSCPAAEECSSCAMSTGNVCACPEVCEGCEAAINELYSCIRDLCPACAAPPAE